MESSATRSTFFFNVVHVHSPSLELLDYHMGYSLAIPYSAKTKFCHPLSQCLNETLVVKDTCHFHSSHTQICQRCCRSHTVNRVDCADSHGPGTPPLVVIPCSYPTPAARNRDPTKHSKGWCNYNMYSGVCVYMYVGTCTCTCCIHVHVHVHVVSMHGQLSNVHYLAGQRFEYLWSTI